MRAIGSKIALALAFAASAQSSANAAGPQADWTAVPMVETAVGFSTNHAVQLSLPLGLTVQASASFGEKTWGVKGDAGAPRVSINMPLSATITERHGAKTTPLSDGGTITRYADKSGMHVIVRRVTGFAGPAIGPLVCHASISGKNAGALPMLEKICLSAKKTPQYEGGLLFLCAIPDRADWKNAGADIKPALLLRLLEAFGNPKLTALAVAAVRTPQGLKTLKAEARKVVASCPFAEGLAR